MWSASRWPESWWWRSQMSQSRASSCSWFAWRPAVSSTRRISSFLCFVAELELLSAVLRLCWRLRPRLHRDPEHPDRRGRRLSRPLDSHLHDFPPPVHLPHTGDHQLQSGSVKALLMNTLNDRRLDANKTSFCPSEFEINVVVVLHDDLLITENFPLKLCRTWTDPRCPSGSASPDPLVLSSTGTNQALHDATF